mgnify:CR=1 FL=1
MTVFDCFPNAVEQRAWKLLKIERATEVGTRKRVVATFKPIIADGASGTLNNSPNADGISSDLLLYCRPIEVQTLAWSFGAVAGYAVQSPDGFDYEIVNCGQGKNQNTGKLEHIELELKMTEFVE